MATYLESYDKLSSNLYSTTHKLPTNGIIADKLDIQDQLEDIINNPNEHQYNNTYLSTSLDNLNNIVSQEQHEMQNSKSLLLNMSVLDIQERSLLFQDLQSKCT